MKIFRASALALAAALSCTTLAQAQESPSTPASPAQRGWDPAVMRQHMEARRAEHLKALHDALNIRPDQETAFQAFAAAMGPGDRGDWKQHDQKGDRAALAALTTPERVDRMEQKMEERMSRMHDSMQRRGAAIKALYAVLNSDQKHTLDALPNLLGRDRGGHDQGGMRGHQAMG